MTWGGEDGSEFSWVVFLLPLLETRLAFDLGGVAELCILSWRNRGQVTCGQGLSRTGLGTPPTRHPLSLWVPGLAPIILAFWFEATGVAFGPGGQSLGSQPSVPVGPGLGHTFVSCPKSPELTEGPPSFLAGCWTLAIFASGCRQELTFVPSSHQVCSCGGTLRVLGPARRASPQGRFPPEASPHPLLLSLGCSPEARPSVPL